METKTVALQGEISPETLELEGIDELVHVTVPLKYELEAQLFDHAVLVQGHLHLDLQCECARCLKRYAHSIDVPEWAVHLPLEGEDKVPIQDDCVDLTPWIREDILLLFPQHPLCGTECSGLPNAPLVTEPRGAGQTGMESSAWAALDKLKFEKE
ncbi:MAG: YceD family protein [Verrucomicrobiota bacterium]